MVFFFSLTPLLLEVGLGWAPPPVALGVGRKLASDSGRLVVRFCEGPSR